MRIARIWAGTVALLIAMPVLGAGALAWWVLQHRSPDGAFRAELSQINANGRIVVVPDVDELLHRNAPIARADRTELRLMVAGEAFIGMAAPADLAAYLAGVTHTELVQAKLGPGHLTVETREVKSAGKAPAPYVTQSFWVRAATKELRWTPADDRLRHLALIVMAPSGDDPVQLSVALSVGWLSSTTWGLLILGLMLLLLGLLALAWPARPREIIYIIDSEPDTRATLPAAVPALRPAAPALLPHPASAPDAETDPEGPLREPGRASDHARLTPRAPVPAGRPSPVAGSHRRLTSDR
jgi:hypothetical protein